MGSGFGTWIKTERIIINVSCYGYNSGSEGYELLCLSVRGLIGKGTKEDDRLWRFLKETLAVDDVRRLQSLSQVKTGMGLVRAWLRTALNERTLENSLTQLLREDKLR